MAGPTPPLDLPFTPTSASWLNADETFFAKLTRGRLIRGVFRSVGDLKAATRSDSTVPRMNEAGVPAVTIARGETCLRRSLREVMRLNILRQSYLVTS
jgi:hypothetical protein